MSDIPLTPSNSSGVAVRNTRTGVGHPPASSPNQQPQTSPSPVHPRPLIPHHRANPQSIFNNVPPSSAQSSPTPPPPRPGPRAPHVSHTSQSTIAIHQHSPDSPNPTRTGNFAPRRPPLTETLGKHPIYGVESRPQCPSPTSTST